MTGALALGTALVVAASPTAAAPPRTAAPSGALPAATTTTEVEDNGSIATANALALGTTVTGRTSEWEGLGDWGGWEDLDVYRFTLPRDGRLNIALTFPSGLKGDAYDVTVYNAGYATTSLTATRKVPKASTRLAVSVPSSVPTSKRVPVTITVTTAATTRPTGTLVVQVDGVRVKKTLKAGARGKVTVSFPKVATAGKYRLSVTFTPSGSTRTSSTARTVYASLRVV